MALFYPSDWSYVGQLSDESLGHHKTNRRHQDLGRELQSRLDLAEKRLRSYCLGAQFGLVWVVTGKNAMEKAGKNRNNLGKPI